MRTGGFPCRLAGCDRAFQVLDQNSLDALKNASTARTEHEISDHGYHHVRLEEEREAERRRIRTTGRGRKSEWLRWRRSLRQRLGLRMRAWW